MLAELSEKPFNDPDWSFELKLDGFRTLALVRNGKVRLLSRRGGDATKQFPELRDLEVLVVWGDSGRLRQILVNLVGNAIKFTDTGKVVVTAENSAEAAGMLRFSVCDTGVGIPPDKRGIIFDAFTQIDGSPTRKIGGTGLGLAIAARLVKMMGGRIWVESDGQTGSTFHFTACLEEVHTPAEQPAGVP